MASSVITCINSALDVVDFLLSSRFSLFGNGYIFRTQKYRLRNLKTLALLAGKCWNCVHLGFLWITIEDVVTKISPKILPNSFDLEDFGVTYDVFVRAERFAYDFQRDFQSLKRVVEEWYIAISDNTGRSNSLTADEVGEISESVWENLVDLSHLSLVLREAMEPLREYMNFLKNFCYFAARRGFDHSQMKDFLTHTEAVAIRAAHLCFLCGDDIQDEEWLKGMQSKISVLVQRIKPIDPQVCETYTKVKSCSKLSTRINAPTRDMDEDSTIVMKNLIDSLIPILWDMLRLDTCHVVCLKDNWQLLYEGLRSLRTILKKLQPEDIDVKTRDDIGDMVSHAGVLVWSFYLKNVEIDLGLQDLWERIKVFLTEAKEELSQTSTFNSSSINVRGFVDFLLENLMELTNGTVEPIVQNPIQSIKEELLYLKSFLEEFVELCCEQAEQRAFQNRVLEVAYRVEYLIDYLVVGDISHLFSMQFDSVVEDIQNIKTDAWKISSRRDIKIKEVSRTYGHVLQSQKITSFTTEVVGFHDEAMSIKDRLQRGSKQLRVIAIVGMGGLGKTTLAAKVYDDPLVMRYFSTHARCTVSQTLDRKKLLLELLDQIHNDKCSEMTEDDLVEKLRKHLKGKRYLIFLDDVWNIEAWHSLRASFPDDSTGSRIILTSRIHDVAMLDQEPLYLHELNKEESLELLQRKLFPGKDWPLELDNLGMQIAEKCKGLPLTIVILAGLLRTTEQEGWKEIVDGLSSVVSSTEQCMNSMELSYQYLPDYLKPCFLYFGAFPEDQEFSVRRLIGLWIAEGFIRKSELKSLEDTAEDYLKDLIGRSLIMVAKERFIGGVKTCRIHDLLREFCLGKAKGEHFFHLVKEYEELLAFNEPGNLRRLYIHCKPKHLKESKLFCPRARSLFFFSPGRGWFQQEAMMNIFLIHIFKFVRVLDLGGIDLGVEFPSEIEFLVQLRYLAIRGRMTAIPSWVGNLSMLETWIVDPIDEGKVSLPDSIWNLQKLKYIHFGGRGMLPSENPLNSSVLYELDTFYGAVFSFGGSDMEKQIRKFPNIRKLNCILQCHLDDNENIGVPDFLIRLESLTMIWEGFRKVNIHFELSFPANLKKLTLQGFRLHWSKISSIGKLPNLEVLKLHSDSFIGETWEMEEGEFFPKLRYLKLSGLDLVRWTDPDSDDQFPRLEKLVLESCGRLEEMPSCLESTPTLEMIEVWYCSDATTTLVKHIEEVQVNLGNTALMVLIQSSR